MKWNKQLIQQIFWQIINYNWNEEERWELYKEIDNHGW